jgi:predicted metalloprotease with PDZ domain
MRALWLEHGAYGDQYGTGLMEDGFDRILLKTIGNRFKPLWTSFKAAYIDGTQDIDVPSILASQGFNTCAKESNLSEKMVQCLGLRTVVQDSMIRITHVLEGYVGHRSGLCPNDVLVSHQC